MKYQIRANLYFDTLAIPDQIKEALVAVWKHTRVINPCSPDQECSRVEILKNHHDEHPHQPCELITEKNNCPECAESPPPLPAGESP